MAAARLSALTAVINKHEESLLDDWVEQQRAVSTRLGESFAATLRDDCRRFMSALLKSLQEDPEGVAPTGPKWQDTRERLAEISRARARKGLSPSETATFVFSLKQPIFHRLRGELEKQPLQLAEEIWRATLLIDELGLFTAEVYQKGREEVIARQQQEMMELSTPVVQLWEQIIAVPLIGTLDSARTQVVMENLLQKIVDTGAAIAIIDITGVPTVDTLVAQHLLKTVAAARLMGAQCIISGIRPQIAQTIVHLGVDLGDVITKAGLSDAFAIALQRLGMTIRRDTAGA